jgi:hypothetical protein
MPLVPVLSHMNPIHALSNYLFKIHLSILVPSKPRSSNCSPSYKFSSQNSVYTLLCVLTCPAHLICLHLIITTTHGEQYNLRSSSLCRSLQLPPSYIQIFSSAPCSRQHLCVFFPLNATDQFSHPHKTTQNYTFDSLICIVPKS